MPEKPLTIATYAAGASLAAVTLIYVFGPTFFLDDDANSTKKKGVVGLTNMANDCFINSILQALAGLPDLRIYLIRETHRRKLDGPEVYDIDPVALGLGTEKRRIKPGTLEGLQKGLVSFALKDILDKLNERPIQRKVISPQPFIRALEHAFDTRVSRQQQDAQEFLQIVMERLCDEYHAGTKARRQAMKLGVALAAGDTASERQEIAAQFGIDSAIDAARDTREVEEEEAREEALLPEEGFPLEGKIESQIECLTCGFKPKPSVSTFVTLTLNVPHLSSTTLNACFDGIFKVEHIDDFKCEKCRLEHAVQIKTKELSRTSLAPETKARLESDIERIRDAIANDPEQPPEDIELPDSKLAPLRRIARHMYISQFPKVLAIHLSRSMYAVGSVSSKNMARVAFPETLPLGPLLNTKQYRLLGMVTHKGSHNSGHYESFRRQVQPVPFSTPHSFGNDGVYSYQASPSISAVQSPRISIANLPSLNDDLRTSTPTPTSPSMASLSSQSSLPSHAPAPTSAPRDDIESLHPSLSPSPPSPSPSQSPSKARSLRSLTEKAASSVTDLPQSLKRKVRPKQRSNRWWRISDDKIKESKTSDVLSMQKEVYLLFYEMDRQHLR